MAKTSSAFKKIQIAYEDIEREVSDGEDIESETITAKLQKSILKQIDEEYNVAFPFNEGKRATMLARLKLFNNQKRDPSAVGDPLMFTIFNTILASLYEDRLSSQWEGRGGKGDEDVEENLNALSEFDYDLMEKAMLDYYWDWDALFFGRSLLLMMDFNRDEGYKAPVPELLDPVTFIRDPRAKSVNGDVRGRGGMRFGGYEVGATYYELKGLPGYFNLDSLKKDKEVRSLMDEAKDARNEAQGREVFNKSEESLGKHNNYEFNLLNWFTTIKGEKYLVTVGNSRSIIVRLVKLDKYEGRWPIVDRTIYPMSNDWDGVSIPDLTEDKQRAKAVLINLGLRSATSDAIPQYLFDETRIKNKNDLNWKFDKFIGVDGRVDNAIMPMQKSTVHQHVGVIMDILDTAAQRATATPEIQQGGQPDKQRTLGENNLIASKVDTRYSMSAKIFGWSEKSFWKLWYMNYKIFFKDGIDEKVIRLQGPLAPSWRPLTRDNIISDVDPDVRIESKIVSEAKRQMRVQGFNAFAGIAIQNPDNNRRFIERELAKLQGVKKEEMDMMFPPTIDEIQAEAENEVLNAEKLPPIKAQDDHQTHIAIHAKANQNPQSMAHIRQHKKLMLIKRDRPDLFAPQAEAPFQPPPGTPNVRPVGAPAPQPTQ